jgi:Aspartyl/Asparaginyl beta-hydroxylase
MLELLGRRAEKNRARCPATCAALAKVPGVLQAFFSVLEPGKSVPLHDVPYLGDLRYHLGLRVPSEDPPQIRVAGRQQPRCRQNGADGRAASPAHDENPATGPDDATVAIESLCADGGDRARGAAGEGDAGRRGAAPCAGARAVASAGHGRNLPCDCMSCAASSRCWSW